jgi:hypothetical protein
MDDENLVLENKYCYTSGGKLAVRTSSTHTRNSSSSSNNNNNNNNNNNQHRN